MSDRSSSDRSSSGQSSSGQSSSGQSSSGQSWLSDPNRYERACDQAIAMCDGNMRSTIKALIMANEYLEIELQELQAAGSNGCAPERRPRANSDAA